MKTNYSAWVHEIESSPGISAELKAEISAERWPPIEYAAQHEEWLLKKECGGGGADHGKKKKAQCLVQ
jgi:hypothetical protein